MLFFFSYKNLGNPSIAYVVKSLECSHRHKVPHDHRTAEPHTYCFLNKRILIHRD